MDTTPDADPISSLAELDPADAVAPAEELAEQLEADLEQAKEGGEADPPSA